jgi:DNA repair exonuclease SbcCD nuclease subunit
MTSKVQMLIMGDPHVTIGNLDDSKELFKFTTEQIKNNNIKYLVIMGDLFHNHAILRLEIASLWKKFILEVSQLVDHVHILVGNHDEPGSTQLNGNISAPSLVLEGISNNVTIHKNELVEYEGIVFQFISFVKTEEQFNNSVNKSADFIFAHQTFDGAEYDLGFYAPDGFKTNLLPNQKIISGHIHKSQGFNQIFYPGTPKWDTASDANQDKGLCLIDFNKQDFTYKVLSTKNVVTSIYSFSVSEDSIDKEYEKNLKNLLKIKKSKVFLYLKGTASWIGKMKKKYPECLIKAIPTDSKSDKINKNNLVDIYTYIEKTNRANKEIDNNDLICYIKDVFNRVI